MIALLSLVVLMATQTPPANPACSLLTSADAASLIGAGGKSMSITTAPAAATCMIQNGDKVITVLHATASSVEAATGLWNAKKTIVKGEDLAGWPTKAYAGALKDASVVGLTKGKTFVEVRVTDPSPTKSELASKLQRIMKNVSAQMP
jgi:shikimate 5-dehydrogenase